MNLQRINWKFFFKNPQELQPDEFFRVFNTWIPNSPEIFIDVADYQHVHDGPLTLLVGHAVDYALDDTGRRRGFLYSSKREMEGSNAEKLRASFKAINLAAKRLNEDSSLNPKPVFDTQEFHLIVNDRALCPNTSASFDALKPELTKLFDSVYGAGKYNLSSLGAPKERFTVKVKTSENLLLDQIINKI